MYLLLSFEPWAQQCEQAEDDEHGRDHEGVRSEADETQRGYRKPDDGGNVIFFLQPLVEKDDDKHGCHDKIDPGCVKLQQRADQSADRGDDGPVEIVQWCDEEKEPALIDTFGRFCGIIDRKCLVTHAEDEKKLFPAHPLIFFQHRQPIEQMT